MGSRFSELINVEYSSRRFLIIFIVVMIALNFDAAIANDADILSKFAISFWGLLLFIMICLISVFGQYYILRVIKEKNRQAQLKPDINDQIEKLITIAQYTLIGLTAAVVFQLLGFNHYNTHLLILWIAISYGLASLFMGFLSYRFFYWFKLNRSVIVLSFGLAAAMITINALDTIILNIVPLIGKTTHTTPQSEVIFQTGYYPGTVMSLVAWLQSNSVLGYIIATWVSTILLLRGHIRRVGRVKFWILVTVPLIYFMSYNISLFQSLYPNSPVTTPIASNLMIPILLTVFATTLCGILFGIGFWLVSRAIKNADVIRDYMLLTAYGIVLFSPRLMQAYFKQDTLLLGYPMSPLSNYPLS
jgi:hypothetical protein